MRVCSMRMRVHPVPLCYNHPCGQEDFITGNQMVIDVSGGFIHNHVTAGRSATFKSSISDSSLLANVIVTPEWSQNMPLSRVPVAGWEAIWMGKHPWIFKRECSIFTDLKKNITLTTIESRPLHSPERGACNFQDFKIFAKISGHE